MTPPSSALGVGRSALDVPPLISYPARPVNGGRLEDAPPKVGPWTYQPKIDGWRAIVHTPSKRIWNRHGQPLSIAHELEAALSILKCQPFEWLDVEVLDRRSQLLRGTIVVLDWIPQDPSETLASHSYRRSLLDRHFITLPPAPEIVDHDGAPSRVLLIPDNALAGPTGTPEPDICGLLLYNRLQEENAAIGLNFYEGLVAKRTDKPYPIQLLDPKKETPWMMKHRFDQP
jgi:hypothetical protein